MGSVWMMGSVEEVLYMHIVSKTEVRFGLGLVPWVAGRRLLWSRCVYL